MRHYPYVISSVLMNCFHFLIFFVFFLFIFFFFFFFNDTATTEIYTLSLHDALPISAGVTSRGYLNWWVLLGGDTPHLPLQNVLCIRLGSQCVLPAENDQLTHHLKDRKSTRLNSSHVRISYAVFCLKKKKKKKNKKYR